MDETNTPGRVRILSYLVARDGNRLGYCTPEFPSGISFRRMTLIREQQTGEIRLAPFPVHGKPTIDFSSEAVRRKFTDAIVAAIKLDAPDLLKGIKHDD